MKENSPFTGGTEEETPAKSRRFVAGNFLRSWLEDRDDDDDDEESPKAKKSSRQEAETEDKEDKTEKWTDRLREIFRSFVRLEMVPAAETVAEQQPATLEEPESHDDYQYAEASPTLPEPVPAEDEGILAVSAEAQRQYYGHELDDKTEQEQIEDLPDDKETPAAAKQAEAEPSEAETSEPAGGSAETASSQPEPVGEVLRRQQAERLEKRLKRLKRKTKSIKREQEEMHQQQRRFAKELTKQQKAAEKLKKETLPKMEKDREKLRGRLAEEARVRTEADRKITAEVEANRRVQVKTESRPPVTAKRELVSERPAAKPALKTETIPQINRVERSVAETNLPGPNQPHEFNESLYERRHEVKDDPAASQADNLKPTVTTSPLQAAPPFPPPFLPQPQQQVNATAHQPLLTATPPSQQPGGDMYKQAMRSGIWGGIAVSVLLLLALMFMH